MNFVPYKRQFLVGVAQSSASVQAVPLREESVAEVVL